MQTFQQYFYENKTILSHIMESRSGKWDIFIKFASSFEVLSFSIRFFAKFGRHFVSYLFGKPLAHRKRAAGIVGDVGQNSIIFGEKIIFTPFLLTFLKCSHGYRLFGYLVK